MNLLKLVPEIVAENPTGINHVELLKACLERGYVHPRPNFSHDLMVVVKGLARHGILVKSEETRLIQLGRSTAAQEAS